MTTTLSRETQFDWETLAESNDASTRESVYEDDFGNEAREFVQSAQNLLKKELHVVTADAKKSADAFWSLNESMRQEGGKENQGYFGTRVRIVGGGTLEATWYINTFYDGDKKTQGKKNVRSEYLKKGQGDKYPKHAFKTAKDWEREAIEEVEGRYALLRQRAGVLSKLRRNLAEYERLLDKCYSQDEGEQE